jgi:hypothetical protein
LSVKFQTAKLLLLNIGKGYENMISWKNVQEKFPWSIVIFTGGAFALVKGVEVRIEEDKTLLCLFDLFLTKM